MFKNTQDMKEYVKGVLNSKNIQKLPRTLASRMDDFSSAEFFGNAEKMAKYSDAIVKFCTSLQAKEYKNLPETVKFDELPIETLQNRAIVHFRKVRELSELRQRLAEKEEEIYSSIGRIPLTQREKFNSLLVDLQNAVAELK